MRNDNNKKYNKSGRDVKPKTAQDKSEPAPAPSPTKKVKLRLDVEDVVRKRTTPEQPDNGVKILFEDNHIVVVLKPQNMPTQADESGDLDLLTYIKKYIAEKYDKPGEAYIGMVHRLDRPTGGIMVFARTSKAASRLCEQIRSDESDFEKEYLAVTNGLPQRTGKVEHYLVKDVRANTVTVGPSTLDGAQLAQSEITVKDERDGLALVGVNLITGRNHQARVQLKALGSPIVGDYRYAGNKLVKSPHLALWAFRLEFVHPVTGDRMRFIALPPEEFPWTQFAVEKLVDIVRPQ